MAHKKQYFRIRCPASFAIMMQGVTPTHIVPFGHFGFTAKYKCISYQNDTDNFFSRIPHDQIPWYLSLLVKHASVTRRTNHLFCISLWRLWWITPLAYLVTGAFRPIGCKHFARVAVLACTTLVGCIGIGPTQSTPVHQIPNGTLLALSLLHEREQQLARSPLGYGCIHIHIHPLAVAIKQERAFGVLLCLA